jgi:ADP-heptose:LPS heptosyltransferase
MTDQLQTPAYPELQVPEHPQPESFLEVCSIMVAQGGRSASDHVPVPDNLFTTDRAERILKNYDLEGKSYALIALQPEGDWESNISREWHEQNRWPADRFARLYNALADGNMFDDIFFVIADRQDQECFNALVPIVEQTHGKPAALDFSGKQSKDLGYVDFLALAKSSKLTVSANNDLAAMAMIMEGPVVALGDGEWELDSFRPQRAPHEYEVIAGELEDIRLEDVLKAVDSTIAAGAEI